MSFLSLNTIKKKLLTFFYIQLFITLVSLPILLCWGLPFSPLTFIGNPVFAPFLSIFLLLSSLFFFTELLNIPNTLIAHALDLFSSFWSWCIRCGSPSWLITFAQPNRVTIVLIIGVAFAIVQLSAHYEIKIVLLAALLVLSTSYLFYWGAPSSYYHCITRHHGNVIIAHHNKQTVMIDVGCLARTSRSWLEYTLINDLVRKLGTNTIDHLILLQPTAGLFSTLHCLSRLTSIKHVYLPVWRGRLTKNQWRHFFEFRRTLTANAGNLIRLKNTLMLSLEAGSHLTIKPHTTVIKSGSLSYHAFSVYGDIGGKNIYAFVEKTFTKN